MAYYGFGDKETIIGQVASLISSISGVAFVDYQRAYDTGITPDKFPGAFVNDIDEAKEKILLDLYKNTLQIGIVAWTRANASENLWSKVNTFIQAILAKLADSPTLNSQAYSSRVTRVTTDSGSRHPIGVFAIVIEVIYFSGK
jgi:hypothetical protein